MVFEIKKTKDKSGAINKSLYLPESLAKQIQQIAVEHDTSFNKIVVSMIEHCLKDGPG